MGDVVSLKLRPIIRIEGCDGSYYVSVRPVVPDASALRHFACGSEAVTYATELQQRHGWRLRIVNDGDLDGAA